MRNLPQYPVTTAEIEECLRDLAAELSAEGGIGDMRPILLTKAAQIISRLGFVTYDLAEPPQAPKRKTKSSKP